MWFQLMAKIYAAFLSYFSRCKHLSERGCRVWHFLCKLNLFDFPHFNQANSRSIFNSNPQLNAIFSLTYHLTRTKNETRMNINDMNIRTATEMTGGFVIVKFEYRTDVRKTNVIWNRLWPVSVARLWRYYVVCVLWFWLNLSSFLISGIHSK